MSANAHNVRWLLGTDGILQKETDSIEALYRFSINNQNVNGGFYQYDVNNNVYVTEPNGWRVSGTALTATTIASCYGLDSAKITNFTAIGGPNDFIGDLNFHGIEFDYLGYRYTLGVNALSAVNTRIALNEAPMLSGVPSSVQVVEDVLSNLDLSSLTFADGDDDSLKVELTVSAGSFSLPVSSGGVTAGLPSSSVVQLVGRAGNINAWLRISGNLQYLTAPNASGTNVATLTVSATDEIDNLASNPSITINATNTPDVVTVTAAPTSGHYRAGDLIRIEIVFDEPVTAAELWLILGDAA